MASWLFGRRPRHRQDELLPIRSLPDPLAPHEAVGPTTSLRASQACPRSRQSMAAALQGGGGDFDGTCRPTALGAVSSTALGTGTPVTTFATDVDIVTAMTEIHGIGPPRP